MNLWQTKSEAFKKCVSAATKNPSFHKLKNCESVAKKAKLLKKNKSVAKK